MCHFWLYPGCTSIARNRGDLLNLALHRTVMAPAALPLMSGRPALARCVLVVLLPRLRFDRSGTESSPAVVAQVSGTVLTVRSPKAVPAATPTC